MNIKNEKTIGQIVGLRTNEQLHPFRSFVANRIVDSVHRKLVHDVQPGVSGTIRLDELGYEVWKMCKDELYETYKGFHLLLSRSR